LPSILARSASKSRRVKFQIERPRSSLDVGLKSERPLFEFGQRRDVVVGENLPLDDREEDLDLVEPTGMDRGVDENCIRAASTGIVCEHPTITGAKAHKPFESLCMVCRTTRSFRTAHPPANDCRSSPAASVRPSCCSFECHGSMDTGASLIEGGRRHVLRGFWSALMR
jgi:hypothetical protein